MSPPRFTGEQAVMPALLALAFVVADGVWSELGVLTPSTGPSAIYDPVP